MNVIKLKHIKSADVVIEDEVVEIEGENIDGDEAVSSYFIDAVVEVGGYPVIIKPSSESGIIGGRGMGIIYGKDYLIDYIQNAEVSFKKGAKFEVSQFLQDAIEVDVDCLVDQLGNFAVIGMCEQVERAGIHSGDCTFSCPPYSLSKEILMALEMHSNALARSLEIVGLVNIQFAIQLWNDMGVYIIECNPRASRTVPVASKVHGKPFVQIGARCMCDSKFNMFEELEGYDRPYHERLPEYFGVKTSEFPFSKFPNHDPKYSPSMKSTGEALCLDKTFLKAYRKAQEAIGMFPKKKRLLISLTDNDKSSLFVRHLIRLSIGYHLVIYATEGTHYFLTEQSLESFGNVRLKLLKDLPTLIENDGIDLVINTRSELKGSKNQIGAQIRQVMILEKIPYVVTLASAYVMFDALLDCRPMKETNITSLQDLDCYGDGE